LLFLSGCGTRDSASPESARIPEYQVDCIGVLPVVFMTGTQETVPAEKEDGLHKGAEVMNRLLFQELSSQSNIRFVSEEHLSGLQLTGGENTLAMVKLVGKSIGCNAILDTRLMRYSERVGGNYSAESPAAVSFDMKLIGIDSGMVIWSAKFDEVQKPVMENLYEWGKAKTRGFTWITAEKLMLEGIREKFADSHYFKGSGSNREKVSQPEDKV